MPVRNLYLRLTVRKSCACKVNAGGLEFVRMDPGTNLLGSKMCRIYRRQELRILSIVEGYEILVNVATPGFFGKNSADCREGVKAVLGEGAYSPYCNPVTGGRTGSLRAILRAKSHLPFPNPCAGKVSCA